MHEKYPLVLCATELFGMPERHHIEDIDVGMNITYSIHIFGCDPKTCATGHDATNLLIKNGAPGLISSLDVKEAKGAKRAVVEIVHTSNSNIGGTANGLDADAMNSVQGIYGVKIEEVFFFGKSTQTGEKVFGFNIHDVKNGDTGKQLYNMTVTKTNVEADETAGAGNEWLRMNCGPGKNQMCAMNNKSEGTDDVYSWVVEKTDNAQSVKVHAFLLCHVLRFILLKFSKLQDLLLSGIDAFNSKIIFKLNVDSNEESLLKKTSGQYFTYSPPEVTRSLTRGGGGATRGAGGATRGAGGTSMKVFQYNTETAAAPSFKVVTRKVDMERPTLFLKFKGTFTEAELCQDSDRFKNIIDQMNLDADNV